MTNKSNIPINTEKSPTVVLDLIYRMRVRDVMTKDVVTAKPTDSLETIKQLMKKHNVTGIPVLKNKRLMGIVSIDDILKAIDSGYIKELASKHMSKKLIILEDDMPLSFAISYFNKFRYGRFPVVSKDNMLVGILSSRDINIGLLTELNKEIERLEGTMREASQIRETGKVKRIFRIHKYDFENAGKASNEIKKILVEKKIAPKDIRRVATAAYEMEMNIVVHSEGGIVRMTIDSEKAEIMAKDLAPGIKDPELALQEGYTTANEWIKSLGFGAGMGLSNIKRVSDEFKIVSALGKGTTVRATIFFGHKQENEKNTKGVSS